MPAGLRVRLAERGGGAPAAGGSRAGEEEGETGRASQASPGRGGETGRHHERCGRKEGEKNKCMFANTSVYMITGLFTYIYYDINYGIFCYLLKPLLQKSFKK